MPNLHHSHDTQPPASEEALSLHFIADETAVRNMLSVIRNWLCTAAIASEVQGNIELVMAEALNNVVEHAYADLPRGPVQIDIWKYDAYLAITLCDAGQPMPGLKLPQTKLPNNDGPLCDLPEGGFGWFLIHQLTDKLTYQRLLGKNRICFQICTNPLDIA